MGSMCRYSAVAIAGFLLAGCFLIPTDVDESPLVDLANRLYLDGDWAWVDSVAYTVYVPTGDSVEHRGYYIVAGTATLEPVDSTDIETYVLIGTAQLTHIDSTQFGEFANWTVDALEFKDTVRVENDTIFGMSVEPIPPEANPTTNRIRWSFPSDRLWCTNWLTNTDPPSNAENCSTVITWDRTDETPPDSTL